MYNSYKKHLYIPLALASLIFAQSSTAEEVSLVNIYHPTTTCALLGDIEAANLSGGPSIIDLGGLVFELENDCATQAALCGAPVTVLGCYANGVNYSFGPTGLPEITSQMTIANGRIIRGTDANIPFRLISVITAAPDNLSLFKVTLENGSAQPYTNAGPPAESDSGNGGGVFVASGASLVLQSSKIGFNLADDSGGGIYVDCGGTLDAQFSIISHNTAEAANVLNLKGGGGGIYLALCALAHNKKLGAVLGSLDNSTVSYNSTPGLGGGLNNQGSAQSILNSTFSYNLTCVSVPGSGECLIGSNPTGAGGGIYNDSTAVFLEITQSTFWANRSLQGGAIYNEEARATAPGAGVYMNNNTIANNFAQLNGGGIYNNGFINQFVSNLVGNNTDFANAAPDIWSLPNAALTGFEYPVLPSPPTGVITEGFNFVGDCGTTGQCQLVNDVNKDIIGGSATVSANIDPRIHDLEWKGGPTETVALFPDSPAVNNGYNNLHLAFDQRGRHFFRTVGQTDIGSYEVQYDSLKFAAL